MEKINLEDFKDNLVKHSTASKAKEKGFYCITPHRYLNEEQIIGGWIGNNTYEPTKKDIETYLSNSEELLIAPTAGVLHQWLKRLHNISVHTKPVYSGVPSVGFVFSPYLFVEKKIHLIFTNKPEESDAFELGLYEALCRI
jgi:hypothetical protein